MQSTGSDITFYLNLVQSVFDCFIYGNEMFIRLANYDKSLKMLHHKLAYETFFLTPSLIGSTNDRIFILTNWQVVLMGLLSDRLSKGLHATLSLCFHHTFHREPISSFHHKLL